jgi:hypothetical protein
LQSTKDNIMNNRQIELYKNMNKREQEIFDHLVNVKNRKPDDVFFFIHSTFNPSRDDVPSFANLSTEQVVNTCQQLQLKDAA